MISTFDDVSEARRRKRIARGRELTALVEQGQRLTPAQRDELDAILAWLQDYNDTAQRENEAFESFMRWARSLPGVQSDTTIEQVMEIAARLGDDRYRLVDGRIVERPETKGGDAPKQSFN